MGQMCKVHGKWLFKHEISFTFQLKCSVHFRARSLDEQVFPKTSLSKLHFASNRQQKRNVCCALMKRRNELLFIMNVT